MFYKGRLRVAGDEGDGIPVDLSLDDVYVDLRAAGGDELGRWRMDVVDVSRLEGNDFRLLLDGEDMVFRASDPLGFAYNAVTTIEEISSRLRKRRRGLFRRRSETPELLRGAAPEPGDESRREPTATTADRIADLRSLMPPDEEVERPPADEDDLFSEFSIEIEEDMPAVSYADDESLVDAARREEPQVESFDAQIDDHEDAAGAEIEPVAVEGDAVPFDVQSFDGDAVAPEAAGSDGAGGDVSGGEDSPEPADDGDLPAAEQFGVVAEGESQSEPDVALLESVDASGSDGSPTTEEIVESMDPAEEASSDVESNADAIAEPESIDADEVESPSEAPSRQDDDAQPDTASPTRQDSGRRRRFFGRGRIDPDHEHSYDESRTVGGITRRVCAICGHVSFAGEDLYEGWK